MNKAEHIKVHKQLHGSFDELVGDFISHTKSSLRETTIMKLIQWSAGQVKAPDD